MDLEVGGARGLHPGVNDFAGEVGTVAITAEMAQINVAEVGVNNGFKRGGGGFVGEVTVAAGNALFERPRAARIILEHFQVVVGFQHEHVGGTDAFTNKAGGVAKVS